MQKILKKIVVELENQREDKEGTEKKDENENVELEGEQKKGEEKEDDISFYISNLSGIQKFDESTTINSEVDALIDYFKFREYGNYSFEVLSNVCSNYQQELEELKEDIEKSRLKRVPLSLMGFREKLKSLTDKEVISNLFPTFNSSYLFFSLIFFFLFIYNISLL